MTTLWRSGSSLYLFFIFLLALVGVFVWLILRQAQTENSEIPTPIELFDFTYYKLQSSTITLEAKAQYAFRDIDAMDHVQFLSLTQQQPEQNDFVYTEILHKQGDLLQFPKGIFYLQNDSWALFSEQGTYDTANKIFEGVGVFSIQDSLGSIIEGEKLYYDYELGLITGDKIQSHIILEQQ